VEIEIRVDGDVRPAIGARSLTRELPAYATVADALADLAATTDETVPIRTLPTRTFFSSFTTAGTTPSMPAVTHSLPRAIG
jgi:hypothetical protein